MLGGGWHSCGIDNDAVFHIKDPVAELCQLFVMGNDQEGLMEIFPQLEE